MHRCFKKLATKSSSPRYEGSSIDNCLDCISFV